MTRNMRRMLGFALIAACSAPAAAQSLEWAEQLGTASSDRSTGVAVDGAGDIYITGYTLSSLGGPSAGDYDAFLAKYDPAGALQWTRQFGTPDEDTALHVAVDAAGGVYIAGRTMQDGWPLKGNAFLAKYDDSGEMQWMRQFGTPAVDGAYSVAVGSAGDVYVVGYTGGSLGGPSAGDYDAFLAKYDPAGALQWTRQLGTPDNDSAHGVAVDSAGGVYITGSTGGSLGGPSAGADDAFLAKYDDSGALQWTRQLGTSNQDRGRGVAVDSSGGVYIAGETYRSLGGPSAGGIDAFLAKYDGSGALQWTRQLGTPETDVANGVGIDDSGGVYIAGYTAGSLGGPSAGYRDVFVARYNASGTLHWTRQFGTESIDTAFSIAVAGAVDVYVTGETMGSLGGPSAGNDDAFLAKYHASTCYADCDGSYSLDFFDFLCFQNLFAAGDSLADCDGSGTLDFLDFLCFQNGFAAGCP